MKHHSPSSRNWYYQQYCKALYKFFINFDRRVLHIGCSSGDILDTVKPCYGIGIVQDPQHLAYTQQRYQHYTFFTSLSELQDQSFDYIIVSDMLMKTNDILNFLNTITPLCHEYTRVFLHCYSPLWKWVFTISNWLGISSTTQTHHWLTYQDIVNLLYLGNFEIVSHRKELLLPYYIPCVSYVVNNIIAHLPIINKLCIVNYIVARALCKASSAHYSASIIIACKNEEGTIRQAIERCPVLGSSTELIFVEGGSTDNTTTLIDQYIAQDLRTDISIRHIKQPGKGKADAIRTGFAQAHGDILLILDGDLTVMPEDLPKFFDAITHAKGEFINGSRLLYPMESQAMMVLNFIANYLFSKGFSWLLGQHFNDTLCGTKAIRRKDYQIIASQRSFITEHDPFGDFDLIFGAAKQCLKIVEIPVHYKNRVYGQTQISRFKDGYMLLCMAFTAYKRFKCRKVVKPCAE